MVAAQLASALISPFSVLRAWLAKDLQDVHVKLEKVALLNKLFVHLHILECCSIISYLQQNMECIFQVGRYIILARLFSSKSGETECPNPELVYPFARAWLNSETGRTIQATP